jgi:hypothetical protein
VFNKTGPKKERGKKLNKAHIVSISEVYKIEKMILNIS